MSHTIKVMTQSTATFRNIAIAVLLTTVLFLGNVMPVFAQGTGAASTASPSAENSLQSAGCSWYYGFSFQDCIATPLGKYVGELMISMGAGILRFAGALFDFGVNHVITDFKGTLQGGLMTVINDAWTFFRDIANILIIGIFVFIAISLILGLKEYGQKKLVARVLIIAVLMNFSLLFTKIIIDASNFVAYSIYRQTLDTNGTGTFSVADKILKPLRVMGVTDNEKTAQQVYAMPAGGAWKAIMYGILGFLILTLLAAVIAYGAFLMIARAVMLVVLMFTAPIAYASYLAPHFEASQFGWGNWWRSLVNNAAFAPLMMVFLTISILIMQTASTTVDSGASIGKLLGDPSRQILADGWEVLFVYTLGTGLLFISFKLASSLAGSISGISLGQSAIRLPLAFGAAMGMNRLGWAGRKSIGNAAAVASDKLSTRMNAALERGDYKALERLRKAKVLADKTAGSSMNLMNTQLGKALAGRAGLAAGALAGEGKKGGVTQDMKDAAAAAEAKVKATQISKEHEASIRAQAAAEAQQAAITSGGQAVELAKAQAEQAKTEREAITAEVEKSAADAVAANATQRETERVVEKTIIEKGESRTGELKQAMETELKGLREAVINSTGNAAHGKAVEDLEKARVRHQSDIDEQDNRIKQANQRLVKIDTDIQAPLTKLNADKAALDAKLKAARDALVQAETQYTAAKDSKPSDYARVSKPVADKRIRDINEAGKERIEEINAQVGRKYSMFTPVQDAATHVADHHSAEITKKKTGTDRIADLLKAQNKEDKADH